MTKNKKIIISIIAGLIIVAIIVVGTVTALNLVNNDKAEKDKVVPTEDTAYKLRLEAEKARAEDNKAQSEKLLIEAQKQYETLPKTDENLNAKADIELQLSMLKASAENTETQPPATP